MAYSFTPCDNCGREVDRVTSDHTTRPDLHWSHVSDGVSTSIFCNPDDDGSTIAIPHPTIRKGQPRNEHQECLDLLRENDRRGN